MEINDHRRFLETSGYAGVVLQKAWLLAGFITLVAAIDAAVTAVAGRLALIVDGVAGLWTGILLIFAELKAGAALRCSVAACE
jgi:hypothetical protein